jgi:diaminopimelate epimerase
VRFTKGHGTGNDFVILEDLDHALDLTPSLVAALCDRRFGIGGDGVLRVLPAADPAAAFFMDYWNSDGSLSEMCGNGIRVFARYLVRSGLVTDPVIPIETRSGLRTVHVEGDQVRVDMGAPIVLGTSSAAVDGAVLAGLGVSMGNPHLVCDVPVDMVDSLDLSRSPGFDVSFFPAGVNVEFSMRLADDHRRMRVYERGSGETLSCGTGACAVGFAALYNDGRGTGVVTVDVPGGRLTVTVDERTSWLTGPAVLVAEGNVDLDAVRVPDYAAG